MQDIPLGYSVKQGISSKSRFKDPLPIIAEKVGYYKRIKDSVVYIPVPVEIARSMALTNDMFFEQMLKDGEELPNSDEEQTDFAKK